MPTRRAFLASLPIGLAAASSSLAGQGATSARHIDRFGVALFTVPKWLSDDFAGTMAKLARIGYKEVEFFGPYPFSAQATKDRWAPLGTQMGIPQTGFFSRTPQQVRAVLDRHKLTAPSMHVDLETMRGDLGPLLEAANTIGMRYAGLPSIPGTERKTLDDYKRRADEFNAIGGRMKAAGVKFLYHNHGYGLVPMEGKIPLQVLLERTDPSVVAFEMDVYWTSAGGADPVALLQQHPVHYRLLHLKDMKTRVRFSGDGGDAPQWMALFPQMSDAGDGVLDLPRILNAAAKAGVQHFFLERDIAEQPTETLERSYRFLSGVEISR